MKEWIVVTGATSGIGRALTVHFVNLHFNVLAIGRNEIELFRTKSLSAYPSNVVPILADLSKKSAIDVIVKRLNTTDKVKYLIHCAATCEPLSPLLDAPEDQIRESMEVNVMTPFILTKKLIPFFDRETRTLFFRSDYVGTANKIRENLTGTYGMTKSALDVVVEYLRRENKNFLVGYINPGATNTKMYQSIVAAAGLFNHSSQPADPMAVAIFVASILTKTNNLSFTSEKWDFRNHTQHHLLSDENPKSKIQSKL